MNLVFDQWFNSAPHRKKYPNDHPAYLAALEAWEAAHEACAKVCEERETYSMPISCPDGIPGCLVAHFVPGSRLKDGVECAAAIRARGKK